MTDLELTELCAQAMGFKYEIKDDWVWEVGVIRLDGMNPTYDPLRDDQQALELLKVQILPWIQRLSDGSWWIRLDEHPYTSTANNKDFNRALIEAVAHLQKRKNEGKEAKEKKICTEENTHKQTQDSKEQVVVKRKKRTRNNDKNEQNKQVL